MATITFAGQLQPTTLRLAPRSPRAHTAGHTNPARHSVRSTSGVGSPALAVRRQAVRDAARTREIQRVYRRRRVGATVGVAAVALAAFIMVFSLFGTSATADSSVGQTFAPKYVVAQPGDTLWSIGERIAPNAAITEVVDELVRLNGTKISAGQLVRIP